MPSTQPKPLAQLTSKNLASFFSEITLSKGQQYFKEGRVLAVDYSEGHLTASATVLSSTNQKYALIVGAFSSGSQTFIFSQCDCPVGKCCKHAAAVIYHFISHSNNNDDIVESWLEKLDDITDEKETEEIDERQHLYVLRLTSKNCFVEIRKGKLNKKGFYGKGSVIAISNPNYLSSWKFSEEEIKLIRLLADQNHYDCKLTIKKEEGYLALKKMLATGRCFLGDDRTPLRINETKDISFIWNSLQGNQQQLHLELANVENWQLLPTEPVTYIDTDNFNIGEINTDIPIEKLMLLKHAPVMSDANVEQLSHQLIKHFPVNVLPETLLVEFEEVNLPLIKKITLTMAQFSNQVQLQPVVIAEFIYGDISFPAHSNKDRFTILKQHSKNIKVIRDLRAEQYAIDDLHLLSLGAIASEYLPLEALQEGVERQLEEGSVWTLGHLPEGIQDWIGFTTVGIEQCKNSGFIVEVADDFDLKIVEPELIIDIDDQEDLGWFSMALTADIDGQQISLLPLIAAWLSHNKEPKDEEELLLPTPNGSFVKIKVSSIRPIISLIEELFTGRDEQLRIPQNRAMLLNDFSAHDISLINGQRVKALADKLADFNGIEPVIVPKSMQATLREYQQEGLNWLCFLKEYGFGGTLADDMGLGKTLQTLAFIMKQQELSLNQRGSLIICPTSLVGNWLKETQKFTPDLRVVVCHGSKRQSILSTLDEYDIVITTYPLIVRDSKHYQDRAFDHIVLDEAQQIKNIQAKVTQQVKELKAGFKLCLSGTPLENHLGELKSLMDFSLIGLLGNHQHFNKYFRQPIEKHGNVAKAKELSRRIEPFLLRRTKNEVMAELPEKTIIEQNVILEKDQRNLYEAIRVTMEKKIRDLFAKKGMANSHIEFLDALLKLRQACCDARLVKLEQAQGVKSNAKLDWLINNLPEMIAEGRKIIIFSQFTTMLGLIEAELKELSIRYSKLTGQTRKRQPQIDGFQEGTNSVFLISLKAGGTGLNLTAADTVIHYDPWWNPAVEKQATDRAHRIGQDKAVFVYKLIAEGTIEEKIQEMQKHKQGIADSVFSGKKQTAWEGRAEELLSLFQ
ncbi:helicase [Parashewanella spongiae]|uniref:Helicase n=1 Tax=Parashewanella spongiae TaxID=342950 RepID=A0A3A6TEB3_9GAMM|nr:DEAD/DEAH box helicase [Parashewanella spongiae]MCL1080150.1 DEAD/DEAH box helicase [Parashewanella spongiae]RJY06357.1 helicase [Parashewanella spongiae]